MNFLDAVKALHDGECDEIRRGHDSYQINGRNFLTDSISSVNFFLADGWELVNPKPKMETVECITKMETVEVIRYECRNCQLMTTRYQDRKCEFCQHTEVVKLTGSYTRPAKKKVKRREEIQVSAYKWVNQELRDYVMPYNRRFFAEWEE